MANMIKVTNSEPRLSGYEKCAILLGELGVDNSQPVLDKLQLKPKETKKLLKTFKQLKKFSYNNPQDLQNEISVLQSVTNYGIYKGLLKKPALSKTDVFIEQNKKEVESMVKTNVTDIANILKNWLDD